jgi:threonyl-tRNA synthetase
MIHRAMLGSLERFLGILIEHTGGAFPFWLAPEQVRVLSITERAAAYAGQVRDTLRGAGLRAQADLRNEKIGAKIREAQLRKVPFMLVVGDREAAAGTVAVRSRRDGDRGAVALDAFVQDALSRIRQRSND